MSASLAISTSGPVRGTVRPPGSKSITNRALVCAALARGGSRLDGALDSQDTQVMAASLERLGIRCTFDSATRSFTLTGCGGRIPAASADLFTANSGTTMRFLTALVSLGHGAYRLHGTARMHQRPIADLLDALQQLGVDAVSEHANGCPPVLVRTQGLEGGHASIRGDVSSQFLSGLLLAAACSQHGVELAIDGPLVSQPYVRTTLAVMQAFGVQVTAEGSKLFVPAGGYAGRHYAIEPDASAASYFFAAAAITGGEVTVEGLTRSGLQGDVGFVDLLEQMGCRVRHARNSITVTGGPLKGIDADMNSISDTAQTLGAVAVFASGATTIRGVAHIRHKETDRLAAMANEFRKVGATVDETADGLRIEPRPLHGAQIETYDDHRMAMSMALIGLKIPGIIILDPGCTEKTYPEFFQDLATICQKA